MPKNTFAEDNSRGTIKKLFSGTAVLTLSAIFTKLTGLFYKVPLIALVGTEGMAYFLAANHIYVLLFVISTAGLPVAVAVSVSSAVARGEHWRVKKIYRTAFLLFGAVGLAASTVMIVGSGAIAAAVGIPQSGRCLVAIAPAVTLSCVAGALRGYFQGHQIMLFTAISQLLEALGKTVFGLAGAYLARRSGLDAPAVAAWAIAGITLGVALSASYLALAKAVFDRRRYGRQTVRGRSPLHGQEWWESSRQRSPLRGQERWERSSFENNITGRARRGTVLGQLIRLALPVTLSSAVISLGGVIDTALIPKSLIASGFSQSQAYTLFSCYGNMAIPLFSLTPALISPIAMTLVPLVSSARGRGDSVGEGEAIVTAIRLTLLLAMPASLGLAMLSGPVLRLIFASDIAAATAAAPLLALLALSVVPACLITTTNAVLQAKGRAESTIISMLCGTAVKLGSELLLVRQPGINIAGAPISTLLCDATVVAVNVLLLVKNSPRLCGLWRPVGITAVCAAVSVGLVGGAWYLTPLGSLPAVGVVAAVALAGGLYLTLCALFGVLGFDQLLNKGRKNDGQSTKEGSTAVP